MPERHRLVVVNTTPIIALALTDQLHLLQLLYVRVYMPAAVQIEVFAGGPEGVGSRELREADWVCSVSLQDPGRAAVIPDLDRGEAEVIALAQELGADLVIIDERLARRHASRLGLRLTGTLGLLLKAKRCGLIPAVAPLVDELRRCGIRLSDALVAEALRLADEM